MMQTTNHRLIFTLSLFLLLPLMSFCFQEEGASSQDSISIQKPQPISVNRLVTEMEDLRALIDQNIRKITPSNRLKRIDSLYSIYKDLIEDEETEGREFMVSNPNQQKINNYIKRWDEYRIQLGGWETEISAYVERNLRLLESFESESEVWDLTYERAKQQEVPGELLSNIGSAINSLNAVEKQTKDYNYTYLRLQSRINRLRQTALEMVQALYDKRDSETYDIFYQRHPPFWQVSSVEDVAKSERESRPATFTDPSSRISELFQTHKDKLYFLLVLGLGLGAFIMYLRRQLMKTFGPEAATSKASESYLLFKFPIVVVIYLLIFVGRLQLLSGTRFLGDILIFILLVLGIILIIYKIPKRYRWLIYASILFLLLDTIKTYVWFDSTNYRIYLLAEAILIAGFIFYFTLGYTNLADLSVKVGTQSGIAAIIAYGLLVVFKSIFISWLEQRFHRSENSNLDQLAFLKKRTEQFLRFAVIFLFVIGFLNIINELRNVTDFISSIMTEPYVVGNLTFTLGSIFMFLLILILSYVLSRIITFLISDEYGLLHFFKLPEGIPSAISLVLRYSILFFGVILALSYLNIDLSEFNLMAGALGLGIGFGLQTVVANFVSGLILVFERPILPGDTVEVNNLFGKVTKIGVRASSISTYDGAEVIVPNMNLVSNDLINWTLSDSIKRIEILVGTTYKADPNEVLRILGECALKFDYVIKDREPLALFTGFGESSLDFRLLFWVPFEVGLRAKSDVSITIYNMLKEAGIEIPYPQRDVHIKDLPPVKRDGVE
ncbi:MAG: mechanosensitive ion channel [Robiginitalea sp.]